jgi:hypothetical protein
VLAASAAGEAEGQEMSSGAQLAAATLGVAAAAVVAWSQYTLAMTGCGLPPGEGCWQEGALLVLWCCCRLASLALLWCCCRLATLALLCSQHVYWHGSHVRNSAAHGYVPNMNTSRQGALTYPRRTCITSTCLSQSVMCSTLKHTRTAPLAPPTLLQAPTAFWAQRRA